MQHKANEYAKRIIMEGIMLACRGMMIFTKDKEGVQHMVSGGTLMEAVYIALEDPGQIGTDSERKKWEEEAKKSIHLTKLRRDNKIEKAAIELDHRTPKDVIQWLKAWVHRFHCL